MRLLKWICAVGLLVGVILLLVPQVTRWYLVQWLSDKGYSAKIADLSVHYSSGDIELRNLDIHSQAGRGLRLNQLLLKLDLLDWWAGRLRILNWHSQGLHVDLLETPTGLAVSGFDLQGLHNFLASSLGVQISSLVAQDSEICREFQGSGLAPSRQCLTLGTLVLSDTQLKQDANSWQLASRSPASLDNVYLRDLDKNIALFYLQKAQFRDFVLSPDWSRLAQLQLTSFHFVERSLDEQKALENPYQTQFGSLLLSDIAFKPGAPAQLHIGLAEATSVRQTLHKDRQAVLLATAQLREFFPALGRVLLQDGASLTLAVGKTRIIDGALGWLDDSVVPAAKESLNGLNLELGALNSLRPEDAVSLTLVTKLGAKGELTLRGTVRPFVADMDFDLQGHVRGLELSNYAAYIKELMNETPKDGVIDGTFQARASFKHINLEANLKLSDLNISGPGWLSRQAGDMTLGRAFGLLRDHNQAVQMAWRQDYDLANAKEPLKAALANGFRRTLVKMAQNDYRPAGLVNLTDVTEDPNALPKFEPFRFNPNERELSNDQARRLKDLAAVVKARPKAHLRLCAVSTGFEWSALYNHGLAIGKGALVADDQVQYLLDMAALRARSIKAQLGELGVSNTHIENCDPEVQMGTKVMSFMSVEIE